MRKQKNFKRRALRQRQREIEAERNFQFYAEAPDTEDKFWDRVDQEHAEAKDQEALEALERHGLQ